MGPEAYAPKRSIILRCGMSVAAIGLLASCERNTFEVPEPVIPDSPAPIFYERNSEVRLGVDLSLKSITKLIDEKVPTSYSGSIPDPTDALTEDQIKWNVQRGGIQFSEGANGELLFGIPITSASASLKGKFGVKKRNKGILGWFESILSADFSETADFAGLISGSLAPKLGSDWTVDPQFSLSINLSKAESRLFGKALKISFREKLEEELGPKIREQVIALNASLRKDPKLRQAILNAWQELNKTTKIQSRPAIWLVTQPVEIRMANPVASGGFLKLRMDAEISTKLLLQEDKPQTEANSQLPPLAPPKQGTPGFDLVVPVAVRLSDFELPEDSKEFSYANGPITVTFSSPSLSGDNGRLVIGVDIDGRHSAIDGSARGRIYVVGYPRLDPTSMTLSLDRADFSVGSKNALVKSASWLLKPVILSELRRRAIYKYSGGQEKIIIETNSKIEKLKEELPPGLVADVKLQRFNIQRLAVDDNWLALVTVASGPAQIMLDLDPEVPMLTTQ